MTASLLSPIDLGPYHLPNRVFMAPLTRNRAPGTIPSPLMAEYYAQRASAGLIISEATPVAAHGHGYPDTPGIHTPEQVAGWQRVTRAVHERGGHMFLQLWHVGRISHPLLQPGGALPIAPSAIRPRGEAVTPEGPKPFVTPRELKTDEIPPLVEEYRKGAANAMEAGFDGVEVHAANGYLIDQFLRDGSNHRSDRYGGSVENRCRFLLEVVEAVNGVWGARRVGVRLSPLNPFNDMYDSDPLKTFTHAVEALDGYGLGYLHVTRWGADQPGEAGPPFELQELRRRWSSVYITNGGYDQAQAEAAIRDGLADAVAFGKLYIANPDLVERFRLGAPLNEPDPDTFYGGGAHGYTDYPVLDQATA